MRLVVVDSSVVIKWVIDEPDSSDALALYGRFRFIFPELVLAECTNVLWKYARSGEISPDAASVAARALNSMNLRLVSLQQLMADALRLAMAMDHPVYDCFFAALAQREASPLITADRKFMRKAVGHMNDIWSLDQLTPDLQ